MFFADLDDRRRASRSSSFLLRLFYAKSPLISPTDFRRAARDKQNSCLVENDLSIDLGFWLVLVLVLGSKSAVLGPRTRLLVINTENLIIWVKRRSTVFILGVCVMPTRIV